MINIPETCQPASITLKPKREKSLLNRHPWVFSGAISRLDGTPRPGDTVDVLAADGRWLARGAYSPRSQIRVRAWSFDPAEAIDREFFERRLQQALDLRRQILADTDTSACRLVTGESDGLPGLVLDRYDGWVVCQFLSAGADRWKATIVDCINDLIPGLSGIYERSDADVRQKEGLALATGRLSGAEPPDQVDIQENGCRYRVDVIAGHKTGFYLDQRENRACVAAYAKGADNSGFGKSAMYLVSQRCEMIPNHLSSAPFLQADFGITVQFFTNCFHSRKINPDVIRDVHDRGVPLNFIFGRPKRLMLEFCFQSNEK